MSQKVVIEHVKVQGAAPYLGTCATETNETVPLYSSNPDIVMRWLCNGWRCRYNQLRSRRQKWDKTRQALIPLGDELDMRTDKQVRAECSWLAAIPAMILQSPNRIENTDWWSANKRRKTLRKQHRNPGMMPRFKSRRDDLYFVCWHNKGMNANYRKLNKHHGEIIITGQNPKAHNLDGQRCRYNIHIRVRISQPIRDYTSIGVNWTKKTVVFINEPLPVSRTRTGAMVGIDRGVAHTLATSDGHFIDMPQAKLDKIDKEIRRRQKAQARRVRLSGKPLSEYRKRASRAYARTQQEIKTLHAKAHRVINDWQHKTTTRLAQQYDAISVENLNLQGMTRRCKAKPDPNHQGRYLRNGQSAKRGLNRSMRTAALGGIVQKLEYKTRLAAYSSLILVNPAYTSQTCSNCKYCAKNNRESQAVFVCKQCGHSMNADVNAAINILNRGVDHVLGLDEAERAVTIQDARTVQHGESAIVARKTSTRH